VGVTYTRAADRGADRVARGLGPIDLRLIAVSLVAVAGVALTSAAKLATIDFTPVAGPSINLNLVRDARPLEGPLEQVFSNPVDRHFAALELSGFLSGSSADWRTLPNVGAIGHAQVSLDAVRRTRGLERYADRARAIEDLPPNRLRQGYGESAGAAAKAEGGSHGITSDGAPGTSVDVVQRSTMALLTPAEIATLKPSFTVRSRRQFVWSVLWSTMVYVVGFHAAAAFWWWRRRRGDRVLLAAAHLLTAIGLCTIIARPDPLRDLLLFPRYAQTVAAGAMAMALVTVIDFRTPRFRQLTYVPLLAAFLLSLMLIAFGRGPGGSTARVNLGPVQPIEAIRLLLVLFLAGYFARRWELLRQLRQVSFRARELPRWLNMPRAEYALPVVVGIAAALGLLFLQKDLGPALILGLLFLGLYAIARRRIGMPVAGLALLLLGFYVSYRLHLPPTVVDRVRIWQSPWDNAVRGGDQIAHAMWALASGGAAGTGLGLGSTRYLPAGHTDLILASVGEELGAVGLAIVAALYFAIGWRAFRASRRASTDYELFLAVGAALLVTIPALLMACAIVGVTPLTGVVTPFLSYGGSAMLANFAALGILSSIQANGAENQALHAFETPLRWLAAAPIVLGVLPAVVLANIQVRHADDYAIKPHLGLQADGSRRYAYNPRILDVVRQIPRGSVYDRAGLPLATDDDAVMQKAAPIYQRLGVSLDTICPAPAARCYPLGGRAFHLLGDARSRVNWTASNTSFIERDDEARLRGFDDHAQAVPVFDGTGAETWTVRRDFRQVLPLLRHRFEPDHPDVKALLNRRRDVRLTLDARFQLKVADIVATYARKSSTGMAAAVVIDADSGELLASVSYPWPAVTTSGFDTSVPASLLDRARYGLYPPGSTFKLITAAAALRQDPRSADAKFTCVQLPDGRVGARVPGWNRPVRDDVKDRRPHGTLDMHSAMVVSCNAYFAQLAVRIGPQALLDTARIVSIALARGNAVQRIRDTLPQVGYGQGEVVVAPVKMAQIAAAIASGGRVPEVHPEPDPRAERTGVTLLPPSAARLLATYMRDVVVSGTGRSLQGEPIPIAGKTGTAEITGAESHAWFVGFAPYGPSRRHIAFAVLLENAGYGGAASAPAAGEIVSAASALGLLGP
jgi:cell division protein FtsW (lipid II flippase)